ncbi:hypothetical protein LRP49_18745 [Enterovibrio sp. ZSDZ35]|uniref:Phosphorelay protein LuxU n=1 Tax=Enterovibrio qingdaonensis TaxID=2899818 RepID=A0ABT5QRV2_9GAMM|nr:hypothetical protein [Enterovibrio sp. ZSDZ35]MDD1783210.1 hypothetical protein [Enterovibrio sp. ZSDZ35]
MKLFGRFILDAGLISAKDLADAMVEQVSQTPQSVEIIYQKGLISPEQVLDIISLQNDEHLDFRTACIRLEIWRTDFIDIINEEVAKRRLTLGQLLVDKELVEPNKLLSVLKQFHVYRAENNNDFALFSDNTLLDLNEENNNSNELDESFSPDFSQVKINNVVDYLDLFSEEKEIELEMKILAIESLGKANQDVNPEELLDQFFTEYHSLKGTARGIGAILTENLIHESEDLLTFYKRFLHKVESSDFVALAATNLKVLDVLSHLRNEMIDTSTEESFWRKPELKEKYLRALHDTKRLFTELESRGYQVDLEDVRDMF